jgi:hypothetical protein
MTLFNKISFSTTESRVRKNKFLVIDTDVDTLWSGTDTRKLYESNLKKQPTDWYYRNNTVRYTTNSNGYRTQEFKNIDWENSVIIFGCSQVFGVGVDDEHTISNQLSKLINYPVINMGIGGSSMMFAFHNAIMLRDGYPLPKAVINLWTEYNRCVFYNRHSVEFYGSWNLKLNNFMDLWNKNDHNSKIHALLIQKSSQSLWANTRYCEMSFMEQTANLLKIDYLPSIDNARDLMHIGIDTTKKTAEILADRLSL